MSLDHFTLLRLLEAILFASAEPLEPEAIARRMPDGAPLAALLEELGQLYSNRGVNLVQVGGGYAFRTAEDLTGHMRVSIEAPRKLSRAAMETLAIIAYHQPVTRAEIEEIRGVGTNRGTIDQLLEAGWIRPRGRRRAPGKPVTWGTTQDFLDGFKLETLDALPGLEELKAAGLLDRRPGMGTIAMRADEAGEPGSAAAEEQDSLFEPEDLWEAVETEDAIALEKD